MSAAAPPRAPAFVGGPTGPGRAAPGPGGYVLAVLVADLLTAVAITVSLSIESVSELALALVATSVLVLLFSLPAAMVCVPVVHLLSRRHPQQWWHVAVTGLITLGAGVVAVCAAGEPELAFVVAPVAVATMIGRACLVPPVRAAQRDFVRAERLR